MKKLILVFMIIAGTTMYAERGDRGDRDIRIDIYKEIHVENADKMSRMNDPKKLDLTVEEVIKQRMEHNMFDRGQGNDR